MKIEGKFYIILNPLKGKSRINEVVTDSSDPKDQKNSNKLEIKTQNGSIIAVNGNVLSVSFSW